MSELISLNNIQVNQKAASWQEAIQIAAQPLTATNAVEEHYVERMIASVNELGPYIVLMPGFALAHSSPGDDIHRTDVSLATFTTPVNFESPNDPVHVVMCLACTDKTSHIARLKEIAQTLMSDNAIQQLQECSTAEQVLAVFKR